MTYGIANRTLTNHRGVYQRISKKKKLPDGSSDICFDINYSDEDGKQYFEKVGYVSEGYTVEQANYIRQHRIKAIRHPELFIDKPLPIKRGGMRIEKAFHHYAETHFVTLKQPKKVQYLFEKHILPYFKDRPINTITRLDVEQFKSHLLTTHITRGRLLNPSSVSKILGRLYSFFVKLHEWKLLQSLDFIKNIKVGRVDNCRERILSELEVKQVLDLSKNSKNANLYYIIKIGLFTGLRINEILTLNTEKISLENGLLYLNGKTGRRNAYIVDFLKEDFKYLINKSNNGYLFQKDGKPFRYETIRKHFIKIVDQLGLNNNVTDGTQRVVFHTLRHTFCSWLAMSGVSLYMIGQLAGHTSMETTQRYSKLNLTSKQNALGHLRSYFDDALK